MKRILGTSHRQSDFEQMVNYGDYRFFGRVTELDLAPTPALCDCACKWLREKLASIENQTDDPEVRTVSDNAGYVEILLWFANHHCTFDQIGKYEAILRSYADANAEFLATTFDRIAEIKRPQNTR